MYGTHCGNSVGETRLPGYRADISLKEVMAQCVEHGRTPYIIRLPDYRVFQVYVAEDALGEECLQKICGVLGIVETDYFSLCYKHKYGMVWINKRVRLKRQLKEQKPPYLLDMRVKFYVPPENIIQMTTRDFFYKQLKLDMKEGELAVPLSKTGWIGSLLAQTEMGDCPCSPIPMLIYPQYFAVWEKGVPRRIALEHQKLRGMNREDAMKLFVNEAAKLDKYGSRTFTVTDLEGVHIVFGIGGKCVHIEYPFHEKPNQKVSYHVLTEASFDGMKFRIKYKAYSSGEFTDNELTLKTSSPKMAHLMFRILTEDHTYFTQPTVHNRVLNHFERERLYVIVKASLLNKPIERKYHFDVVRTVAESFQYHWRKLHQMSTEPRQIVVSGGAAESMATLGESPVEEAQDQSIREDLITATVNPTPPTMEEIQHSINGRRNNGGGLSRWRGRILHRRQTESHVAQDTDPGPHSEDQTSPLVSPSRSLLSPSNFLLSDSSELQQTDQNLIESDDIQDQDGRSSIKPDPHHCHFDEEDNPIPLWMSFSPSVEHFIDKVLKYSPKQGSTLLPTCSSSEHSVTASSSSTKDVKFSGTHKIRAKIDFNIDERREVNPEISNRQDTPLQESTEDNHALLQEELGSVAEKKKARKQSAKRTQVHVAGLSESSLRVVKPVIEKINDNFICKVCMDRFVNTTFCPCGHYVTCRQCAQMLTNCPICRSPITHSMLIYQ